MEGRSSADRRGGRYHVILCVVIGEMTLSTCLLCRLLTQDENQSLPIWWRQVNFAAKIWFKTLASYNLWPSQFKKREREVSALVAIHMLLPLVGKNDVWCHFGGAKVYFRRPFWPAECTFVLFLKNSLNVFPKASPSSRRHLLLDIERFFSKEEQKYTLQAKRAA